MNYKFDFNIGRLQFSSFEIDESLNDILISFNTNNNDQVYVLNMNCVDITLSVMKPEYKVSGDIRYRTELTSNIVDYIITKELKKAIEEDIDKAIEVAKRNLK